MRFFSSITVAYLVCSMGPVCLLGAADKTTIQPKTAAGYFQEAHALCQQDNSKLWGKQIYGPMMFVDSKSRDVITNFPDEKGILKKQGDVYIGKLPAKVLTANTSVTWAGVKWAMVLWPLPEDRAARGSLMVHESWHVIQNELGFPSSGAGNRHFDGKEGRVWLQLEWRALTKALTSTKAKQRNHIEDAIVFRNYRRSLIDKSAAEENSMEMHEGLAEYTGLRLCGLTAAERKMTMAKKLVERPKELPTFVRSFAYLTGPAYGLLLDDWKPDWRHGLKPSDDLGKLLANGLNFSPPENLKQEALIRLKKHNGNALVKSETEREKRQNEKIARFRNRFFEEPALILPLKRVQLSFSPSQLVPLGDAGTVYKTITISDLWGKIEVTNHALMSFLKMKARVSVPKNYDLQPKANGWKLTLKKGWKIVPHEKTRNFTLQKTD